MPFIIFPMMMLRSETYPTFSLLDRLLIVPTVEYKPSELEQILRIRYALMLSMLMMVVVNAAKV